MLRVQGTFNRYSKRDKGNLQTAALSGGVRIQPALKTTNPEHFKYNVHRKSKPKVGFADLPGANAGKQHRKPKPKVDFTELPDAKTLAWALDDQYVRLKWRNETSKIITRNIGLNLGLIGVIIVSCLLGGLLFSTMELDNELYDCKMAREKYFVASDRAKRAIFATAMNFQLSRKEREKQYSDTLNRLIHDFRNSTWKGYDCETHTPDWNYLSATLFSVAVVSTVGFGHITTKTIWGRLALVSYAILGIPFYLAVLRRLGSFFSDVLRYVYHRVCCCGSCKKNNTSKERRKMLKKRLISQLKSEANGPSACYIRLLDQSSESSDDEPMLENISTDYSVPTALALSNIPAAIILGASIFSYTENWSFLDGTYFCFSTLSTIGFGDLVPGQVGTTGSWNPAKLAMLWCYIIFGMVILSICFTVLQENAEETIKTLIKALSLRTTSVNKKGKNQSEESDEDCQLYEEENAKAPVADVGRRFDQLPSLEAGPSTSAPEKPAYDPKPGSSQKASSAKDDNPIFLYVDTGTAKNEIIFETYSEHEKPAPKTAIVGIDIEGDEEKKRKKKKKKKNDVELS